MRKLTCITAALSAVFLVAAPVVAPAYAVGAKPTISQSDTAAFQAIVKQGFDRVKARDWQGAKESFEAAIDLPIFNTLPDDLRYHVYVFSAVAEMSTDSLDKAYQHMIDAGNAAPDARDKGYWSTLCSIAQMAKKPEALADAFMHIVTEYPDALKTFDGSFIGQIIQDVRGIKDGHVRLLALLEALHDAKYTPTDPFWTNEWIDYSLMTLYAEKGDDERAKVHAAALADPDSIRDMQIDRRYNRFAPTDDQAFAAATDKKIARLKALAEANPDKIGGVQVTAYALMTANRLPEALQRLDDALAKVASAPKDKPAFSDLGDQLNWIHDTRARVLKKMGRFDEALAALKKGRDIAEASGEDVVSQKINLSDALTDYGQPKEALDEIKSFDPKAASSYGVMSATAARACAYAELGDTAHLKEELDYMKTHAADGQAPLQSALLCAGDLDPLAAQLIGRLDDPDQRAAALGEVQTYLVPEHMTAWQKTVFDRHAALLKRPDVSAAIDKYGFVRSYPEFGPAF
ncbi:MAG: hypothetical protein JF571_04460 [Asticcacaulis sp.]|nr:hypothetical protein [Asticcacaulis sp.]